jgi:hypothetical protein
MKNAAVTIMMIFNIFGSFANPNGTGPIKPPMPNHDFDSLPLIELSKIMKNPIKINAMPINIIVF